MAFVNENQGIGRQVFKQGRRRFARFAAGQITGVVFNAFTMAGGFEHFQVETGALFDTLGFQQFVVIFEVFDSFGQFFANAGNCLRNGRARRDVMIGRVNGDFLQRSGLFAGQAVKFIDVIYLIAEEGYSPGPVFIVGGKDVQRVSLNPESAADEIRLIPFVL